MRRAVLFSGLALLLAGCGSGAGGATTAAPAPPSSSTPVSSATPVLKDLATFMPSDAEVTGLGLDQSQQPLPYIIGSTTPLRLVNACGAAQPWDAAAKRGEQSRAFGPGGEVWQLIAEYDGLTGTQVVDGVKQALACHRVTIEDAGYVVLTEFTPAEKADAQYGFCAGYEGSKTLVRCVMVLAHGNRVTALTTKDPESSGPKTQLALLNKVAPVYSAAFAKD
ncbi:hypothetical protein [Amycolatopsis saalfeldensis]|uniref:PknH-like extracellular domain-containing protein n=1 Tax=Amycolatopsis saalfeldensis TaxID=394193 RepID=A0A1H8T1P3_9PSEU|nr:hypothetical protein [Amycolatopsis saalfeldensis]SEO84518.1 hypothetical protein SAMN04489732_102373 [Amycolatopsis saalfeldensis]